MGEMVANILGLTQSKYQVLLLSLYIKYIHILHVLLTVLHAPIYPYQYVIDAIEFDQWMKERQEEDEMDYVVSKTEGEAKAIVVECPGSIGQSQPCESTESC